ncbi:MAG: hydantoinase/oxoprolinase family protein [Gammaproteobacteria bacterium]|nr:hydantoinase/oxoprolinase family protein [Gammaproteobacteria bacterium]MCP5199118.1 hydantoinase/oxoprolinase family protein [Gammaproteobacteria bacterium]
MMAVDVGGTFTDVVAYADGAIHTAKVSTNVREVYNGVVAGAAELGVGAASVFNHASTHGLNAIITRSLPKVGFLTTVGHRDIPDIGRTWRPAAALTDPSWRRPFGDAARPLVPRYLRRGITERMMADGRVFIPLDEAQARAELEVLKRCNVQGVAICLLNAYVNDAHERRLRELVGEVLGDLPCSVSSEISPLAKEYARASTTLVDVFMKIIYEEYTRKLDAGLRDLGFAGQLNFADCTANLVPADDAMLAPFRVVFAGPAAGTVGSAHFGALIDEPNLICADIGGTSCDISLVTHGQPFVNTTFELEHDLIVNALSNDISSIGAGGGSLVALSPSGDITVGPQSAGADPGPACYGRGGTAPTMTDVCLLAGIIDPDGFAGGKMKLDPGLARAAFEALDTPLAFEQRVRYAFDIGINNIAEGIFNIAIKQGIDPRDYCLMAFGAAGPLLLPALADLIHVKRVIVPPHPGLFSALGLLSADQAYAISQSAYTVLDPANAPAIARVYADMESRLRKRLGRHQDVELVRSFDGQLIGQTWETPFVPVPDGELDAAAVARMVTNFHQAYAERNGNRFEHIPVQGVTYRLRAVVRTDKVRYAELPARNGKPLERIGTSVLRYVADAEQLAQVYARESLCAGDVIAGPAIVREALSTTYITQNQVGRVGRCGEINIERATRGDHA